MEPRTIGYHKTQWFRAILSKVTVGKQSAMVHFLQSEKNPSAELSAAQMAVCHWQLQNKFILSIHVFFFSFLFSCYDIFRKKKAFKGNFTAAHSSAMTVSSSPPHRHLKKHNDYKSDSWLNAFSTERGCTVQVMVRGADESLCC